QRRAIERMRAELDRAHDAPQVRAAADALVALGDAPAPASVRLPGGVDWSVPARPGERAADVAGRLYGEARSKERAQAALPGRLAAARHAPPTVRPTQLGASARRAAPSPAPRVPYKTYRSSGGLEIWVGRGAERRVAARARRCRSARGAPLDRRRRAAGARSRRRRDAGRVAQQGARFVARAG